MNGYSADVNSDGHETILLPLAFNEGSQIPGAFGTVWTGQVWLENRNNVRVQLFECQPLCGDFPSGLASTIGTSLWSRPELGFLLTIPIQQARNLTFSNRIFERTLRSQPRGIDIPVVREGDFFTSEQTFLGVPAGQGVRVSVRAYDPWINYPDAGRPGPALQGVSVEVRDKDQRVVGTTTLRPLNPTIPVYDFHKPGFDVVNDLVGLFGAVAQLPYVHVRVRAVPAGAQFWAMVSITDNETQTVSIITAQ